MTFEDDLLALEARVLEQAGGDFFRAVAELRRMLAAESGDVGRQLEELAIPALQEAAVQGALDGWTLGGQRAVTDAGTARRVDPNTLNDADLRLLTPPAHLTDPFTGLDGLLADAKTRAVALLRSGADAQTATSPIFQAATTARARIVTQVNAASNVAALEVGDATRSPMVWEAERDGCVYCLALAGEVVERAGDSFPPADLYAPTPSSMTTTSAPPLHPHCRCRLAVLVSTEYADALKREAQRSILRGHSLASESQAVRVRAAARLLERDPVAPKTVKAFAAAAVKRGHFPTREVPKGDPRLVITRGGPPKAPPPPEPPKPPERPAMPGFFQTFKQGAPESALVASRKVNPRYRDGPDWRVNCTNVVTAVEMRARGWDVLAAPRPTLKGRYKEEMEADWVDNYGGTRKFERVNSKLTQADDLAALERATEDMPDGARGFVEFAWDLGGRHVINWVKRGTGPGLRFYEGQNPDTTPVEARAYFKRVERGSVHFLRVDDLIPTDNMVDALRPSEATPRRTAPAASLTRLEAMRKFGLDSPEFRQWVRDDRNRRAT